MCSPEYSNLLGTKYWHQMLLFSVLSLQLNLEIFGYFKVLQTCFYFSTEFMPSPNPLLWWLQKTLKNRRLSVKSLFVFVSSGLL